MRARQIAMSMISTVIFFLLAATTFLASYGIRVQGEAEASKIVFVVGIAFLLMFIMNLIFGINACSGKLWSIGLLIMAIIGLPFGGLLGIFNLISYIYAKKYLDGEYVMSFAERRRMNRELRRQRRAEEKERRNSDPDYRRFINELKKRKVYAIFKNLILLGLTFMHSVFCLVLVLTVTESEGLTFLVVLGYLFLCPLTLFLKGIDPFFTYDYVKSTTTSTTSYVDDDWFGDPIYRTESKTEHEGRTGAFLTIPGLLYFLIAWIVCITQALGLIICILTKYNNRRIVCGRSIKKIPRPALALGKTGSVITYFLFTFVVVKDNYLDYVEGCFR